MIFDKPEGEPDARVGWASDVAAQMLRRLGFKYVSLNPGASYRGLHDSIVNHLGNERPTMLLCVHEDHAVGIAQGYGKATGEPMACILHSNVGLMHGMMGIFNAWCDRVPIFILGATGPVDAAKRRPWVDWIHTAADQGGMIRNIVKFDNQPSSPQAIIDAMCRADVMARTLPKAPVYVCLDAGLQEQSLEKEPAWPDLSRFQPPVEPTAPRSEIEKVAAMLKAAKTPLICFGRGSRRQVDWDARVALAERTGAVVMTDARTSAVFPTDHPAHVPIPLGGGSAINREVLNKADFILALEWPDLGGLVDPPGVAMAAPAKIVNVSLDQALHNGAHMVFQQMPPADVFLQASHDAVVHDLVAALGAGKRDVWHGPLPVNTKIDPARISIRQVAKSLRDCFDDPDNVSLATTCHGWPRDVWPYRGPLSYFGKDGGGGIGSGPSIAVGVALAMQDVGRPTVTFLGDGDFLMGGHALWTAVHCKIPLLVLINNNRSYMNDELHQQAVALDRNRPVANRWVGQAMINPDIDLATFARSQGALGIGPIREAKDVDAAVRQGVDVLKAGGVCLIDLHIEPEDGRTVAKRMN